MFFLILSPFLIFYFLFLILNPFTPESGINFYNDVAFLEFACLRMTDKNELIFTEKPGTGLPVENASSRVEGGADGEGFGC